MGLDAAAIRSVIPPASRGADDVLLNTYLEEREGWLARQFGGKLPDSDAVVRGILRDLAGSAAMRKLATNEEERRAADALRDDAMMRLDSYGTDSATDAIGTPPAEMWVMPW
jgi:hypothetical protein